MLAAAIATASDKVLAIARRRAMRLEFRAWEGIRSSPDLDVGLE
jgi:hypothetical protein